MKVIEERTPIDELLEEQQRLRTPVTDFSDFHDRAEVSDLESVYRNLIPLSRPRPGEQYAFEVDMDACTGCKACVTGCHSMNGLEKHETWRDVGMIHSRNGHAYQQTVTSACHHCVEPACMHGCPVLAYEKDAETGIVLHLDDQCIGCQYCVLKCPYDVPKYSEFLGIVRKCDMCHGRLAEAEAPACVQACPTSAISIAIVDTDEVISRGVKNEFLAGTPDSCYTLPSTRYMSARDIPNDTVAADQFRVEPQPMHLPLVLMLVFTQMAVGCFGMTLFQPNPVLVWGGFVSLLVGLIAAATHLGKPWGAWRSFLGLRRSWLSREIVIFGALMPVAVGYVLFPERADLAWSTFLLGGLGIYCSVMIYADTQRPFWSVGWSSIRFFGTMVTLGFASQLMVPGQSPVLPGILMLVAVTKLVLELFQFRLEKFSNSRAVMIGPLLGKTRTRIALGVTAGFVLPICILFVGNEELKTILGFSAWFLLLVAETLERMAYFQAVEAPHMPRGGVG